MSKTKSMTLEFRCPAELEGKLPPPIMASLGLPSWLKAMPTQMFNSIDMREEDTVKRCPPFVDAMTTGFLIPLICDLRIENGEITWDNELPPGGAFDYPRSPIGFHDSSQVVDSPLFEPDRLLIKFHNLWTIRAPEGYALLFTHPVNRFDLPFTTLSGLVDCDRFSRRLDPFSRALARREFQRRAAKGHPGRAVCAGETGKLGRAACAPDGRGGAAGARSDESDPSRTRTLSA